MTWIVEILLTADHKFTMAALELLIYCSNECTLMKSCIMCYENKINDPTDWMKRPCNQPHLIVWVDIKQIDFWPVYKDFSYWPAKLVAVSDEHLVTVVFFGYHELFKVPPNVCHLYSSHNPDPKCWTTNPREIVIAIEVSYFYTQWTFSLKSDNLPIIIDKNGPN